MTAFAYKTIEGPSTGLYKEKGSKFISLLFPVETENDIKAHVTKVKEEYFDARHRCYAYMLGADRLVFRMNDDGEPSSTAGKPILGQINSNGLTNILIIVVRYFGGTKLGVSGLINAYKLAAADGIANSIIVDRKVKSKIIVNFDYSVLSDVMKLVKDDNKIIILDKTFENICEMTLSVDLDYTDILISKLSMFNYVKIQNS